MPDPTNKQLEAQIKEVDRRGERRHKSMLTTINKFKAEVNEQLQPFHDYLVGEAAIEKNKSEKGAAINISPDIIKLLTLLAGIIMALLGAKAIQ